MEAKILILVMPIGVKSGPVEALASNISFLFFFQKEEFNWSSRAEPTEPPGPPISLILSIAAACQTPVDPITTFVMSPDCGKHASRKNGNSEIFECPLLKCFVLILGWAGWHFPLPNALPHQLILTSLPVKKLVMIS